MSDALPSESEAAYNVNLLTTHRSMKGTGVMHDVNGGAINGSVMRAKCPLLHVAKVTC